jgi:hypothetical protein
MLPNNLCCTCKMELLGTFVCGFTSQNNVVAITIVELAYFGSQSLEHVT